MAVIFKTFDLIEIDGIVAGNIVDVISNHAPRRAEVLAAYGVYVSALQTAFESEKLQLTTNLTTLTNTVTANNSEIAAKADMIKSLKNNNQSLNTELATANLSIAQLQSRINYLESIKPFNDGLIKIEAFMKRCEPYMARLMFAAYEEIPANGFDDIVSILNGKVKVGEPVNMNSQTFAWAMGKIRTLSDVTEEEIAILTRPASREEAYVEVLGE